MKLELLKLTNFRNYERISFQPSEKINILYGKNGSGKTNIVEAIYILALTKSFRTLNDKHLIKKGEEYLRLEGIFYNEKSKTNFKILFDQKGKTVYIDNDKIKLLSDYISKINIILFNPSDLKLIKDSPSVRRKYLNIEISQYDKNYLFYLNDYNKLLKQRNSYIKQLSLNFNNSFEYLDILTRELISKGLKVYEYRKRFIDKINELIGVYYNKIALTDNVYVKYKSQYKDKDVDNLLKIYEKNRMRELNLGKTLIGVHLDDFDIYLDDNNIRDFGSEGQQKNAIVSLKFSEVDILKEKKGLYPILILDDIFSELDSEKINNILNIIPECMQTFITTTEVNKLDEKIIKESKIFKIDKSMVETE